jgi:hypothetical protein
MAHRAGTAIAVVAAWSVGLGLAACDSLPSVFTCANSAACVDGALQGTCEPTGFCSFPDGACPDSGRRYAAYAGEGLGGTCVAATADGGLPDGGSTDGGLANLLPNPGCENGLVGWSDFQSTLGLSSIAHGGSYACESCVEAGYGDFTFDDDDQGMSAVYSPLVGQVYRASAWVRS